MADWSLINDSVWWCRVNILQRPEIIVVGEGAVDSISVDRPNGPKEPVPFGEAK